MIQGFLTKLEAVREYEPLYGVLDALRWKHIKQYVPEHYTQRHLRMRVSQPWPIRVLLWIGFVKFGRKWRYLSNDGTGPRVYSLDNNYIVWPFEAPPAWAFSSWKAFHAYCSAGDWFYLFRNSPVVIKWLPGRLLPKRWASASADLNLETADDRVFNCRRIRDPSAALHFDAWRCVPCVCCAC